MDPSSKSLAKDWKQF